MCIFTKLCFVLVLVGLTTACHARETIHIETPSGDRMAFHVSVAKTPEEQQKGLMFVTEMPAEEGMIFLYPYPQRTLFWMKNTLIPLDMLFFDSTNTLIHIEHSAQPHDEMPRGPRADNICAVVEVNGGTAKARHITVGSKLLSNVTQECLQSSLK